MSDERHLHEVDVPRSINPFHLALFVLSARALGAQASSRPFAAPTFAVGTVAQQTVDLGTIWPGLTVSGGIDFVLGGNVAIRTEALGAGFLAGGSVSPDCVAGAECIERTTPSVAIGATTSIVVGHGGPFYGSVGVGAWGVIQPNTYIERGPTVAVGLRVPGARHVAVEARYDHPSIPIGLLRSTFAVSLRFSR